MSLPEDVIADIRSAITKLNNAISAKTVADQEWGEWDLTIEKLEALLDN
jgi:hypothetical protein